MLLKKLFQSKPYSFSTLTLTQAELRAKYILKNSVNYNSHITLHKGSSYHGFTNINFETTQQKPSASDSLRIDFQGKKLTGLMINEKILESPQKYHKNGQILIPIDLVQTGEPNNLGIQYQNDYDKDGNGCVSFIDTDHKQYLYTQFEPYFANRVFPLFDQPDIKAPLTLTLACPADWQAVLSNQFESQASSRKVSVAKITENIIASYHDAYNRFVSKYESSIPSDYKITTFGQTKPLSSYLYCFVVGPYKELAINLQPQNDTLKIPMRLYSIESLYPQLVKLAPFIEQITVKSMNFFQKYFGYPYPFSKYDQVFAHEYKWGAMQNAGIVTFNDLYLFKDKVSTERLLSFGNTIVHELAHHWFGNLVTMKWWDDLWLNESFAQYISHFCLQKIKPQLKTISFQSAMISFFNRKNWGYLDDELVTTHPIRTPVSDTFTAQSIFDGITYSKGAATMKQLMYLIGQEAFSQALKTYFKKHEFSNAVLDDLLSSMNTYFKVPGLTLRNWKEMWLQTAGTNQLSVEWIPGASKLTIVQGFDRPSLPHLRVHRVKLGIFLNNNKVIEQEFTVLPQQKTIIDYNIPKEAVAILLNYKDLTFAKVEIDPQSRSYFSKNMHRISDSLSRCLVWKSYYNMVKDSKLLADQYVEFCLKNLQYQQSDSILQQQLNNLLNVITAYTPKKYRTNLYEEVFNFLEKQIVNLTSASEENRKVILKDKIIDFCHTPNHSHALFDWYYQKYPEFQKQSLNNTLRWKIIVKLFGRPEFSSQQKHELFEDMKKRDSSDVMINKQIICKVLTATTEELASIYNNFFKKENQKSLTNFIHQMRGFNHEIHEQDLRTLYFQKFYADSRRLLQGNISESEKWFVEGDYLQNFIVHMQPSLDSTTQDLKARRNNLKQLHTSNSKINRTILKKTDLLSKRISIYQNYFKIRQPVK